MPRSYVATIRARARSINASWPIGVWHGPMDRGPLPRIRRVGATRGLARPEE
ncbi:hypothetical protein [Brachybacterium sacelli]|uniref:hypothetical protein n=1 Tax=Brachybacterium sacelli TaxID=173364 RepID=UPI003623B4FF